MRRWVEFVSVGVGVGAPKRILLSVLARNPLKGLASEVSHESRRVKEGPRTEQRRTEKKNNRQNRAVSKKEQELGSVDSEPGWPT